MKRVHLFEFGDKNWFPKKLRDFETDFLEFGANQFDLYKPILPILEKGLAKASRPQIIDMGAGGGGGWSRIIKNFADSGKEIQVKLTDFNPNIGAFEKMKKLFPNVISFENKPINATDVPSNLAGFRTMFLSFHHLKPKQAQQVLQNAVHSGEPIAIFEMQDRSLVSLLSMFVFAPINAIITAPFIKPFSFSRVFLSIFFPILTLAIWFDGLVSNLRTYNQKELKALATKVKGAEKYNWEIEKLKNGPGFILYLFAYKK